MRGSPLARALLVFAALLALSPALWRMTHPESSHAALPVRSEPRDTRQEIQIALAFTTVPSRVVIQHLGMEVWAKEKVEAEEELTLSLPWPKEGGELLFKVGWPENSPAAAMRVILTTRDGDEIERSMWGRGESEKVLRFP